MEDRTLSAHTDILRLFPEELEEVCAQAGEKSYRAGQLFNWLHVRCKNTNFLCL